jgi:tape measure domain-containing protein
MADSENLDVVIRARGGRAAAGEVDQVTKSLRNLDSESGKVATSTRRVGDETGATSNRMASAVATTLRYGAAWTGLAAVGQAFMAGFRFDATMEQNTVAFTHFLGSAGAAKDELAALYEVAAKTPFEFSDITMAARRFLAFGFSVEDANKELAIMGDAVAGIGGGREELNRLALVIGQIQAKGKLQGDELLQLAELGLIGPQQIAQQMGMAQDAFFKAVSNGEVSSKQAITAINDVLVAQFKGSAEEQSRTLLGQLSTAKDYGAQAAGALVQPLVDFAKSDALPRIIEAFKAGGDFLKSTGGQNALASIASIAGPLAQVVALWAAYKVAVWGLNTAIMVYEGLQVAGAILGAMSAAVLLIPSITSLSEAWWLLNAAIEGTWLAALGPVGWAAAVLIAIGALYVKWQWFHNAVNDTFAVVWKVVKAIAGAIRAIGGFMQHPLGVGGGGLPGGGGGLLSKDGLLGLKGVPFLAGGGTIPVGGVAVVGERGPEVARNTGGGTTITPMTGGAAPGPRVLQPIRLEVDGRVFAEVMLDHGQTAAARA